MGYLAGSADGSFRIPREARHTRGIQLLKEVTNVRMVN